MKQTLANVVRNTIVAKLFEQFSAQEDCGMITSGSFNFPVVQDGEEGFVEIIVKVPKYDSDEGYALREDYAMKCDTAKAKAQERAEAKAKKIERDSKAREEKRLAREKAKAESAKAE